MNEMYSNYVNYMKFVILQRGKHWGNWLHYYFNPLIWSWFWNEIKCENMVIKPNPNSNELFQVFGDECMGQYHMTKHGTLTKPHPIYQTLKLPHLTSIIVYDSSD